MTNSTLFEGKNTRVPSARPMTTTPSLRMEASLSLFNTKGESSIPKKAPVCRVLSNDPSCEREKAVVDIIALASVPNMFIETEYTKKPKKMITGDMLPSQKKWPLGANNTVKMNAPRFSRGAREIYNPRIRNPCRRTGLHCPCQPTRKEAQQRSGPWQY